MTTLPSAEDSDNPRPAKHTPRPWTVRENENGTLGIDAHEPDGAYCQPARVNGDANDEFYGPATRANARLIAAAPELLEACRYLLNLCDKHTPGLPEGNENEGKEWKRSMRIARAAIAAAEGPTD